jgi:hypothetical protein
LFTAGVFLLCVSLTILGLNYRHLRNRLSGPFPVTAALVADPGWHEWVRVEGTLVPTGLDEQMTIGLFRGLVQSTSVTAHYLAIPIEGKLLIVKVPADFSGRTVDGTLVGLPEGVRAELDKHRKPGAESVFHPVLLEQESYGWGFWAATGALLLPLSVFVIFGGLRGKNVANHSALKPLAKFGPLRLVVDRIENEMIAGWEKNTVGPISISSNWLVSLAAPLHVYPARDVVAVGIAMSVDKAGQKSFKVRCWRRDHLAAVTIDIDGMHVAGLKAAVIEFMPWAFVEDANGFESRWLHDRKGVTQEIDARRPPVRTAARRA